MRKNNKQDMTIIEQIEAVTEEMCDDYCKYHDKYNMKTKKEDEEFQKICEKCPLGRIGV